MAEQARTRTAIRRVCRHLRFRREGSLAARAVAMGRLRGFECSPIPRPLSQPTVTFNDDIQGTAAITTATLISAINVTGMPLEQQKILVVGFGSAGLGITSLLEQFIEERGLSQ